MNNVPPTQGLNNGQEMEAAQLWNLLMKHSEDRLAAEDQQIPGNNLYSSLTRIIEAGGDGKGNEIPRS